jgi:hypothetical protein
MDRPRRIPSSFTAEKGRLRAVNALSERIKEVFKRQRVHILPQNVPRSSLVFAAFPPIVDESEWRELTDRGLGAIFSKIGGSPCPIQLVPHGACDRFRIPKGRCVR